MFDDLNDPRAYLRPILREAEALLRRALNLWHGETPEHSSDINSVLTAALQHSSQAFDLGQVQVFPFLESDLPRVSCEPVEIYRVFRLVLEQALALHAPGGSVAVRTWMQDRCVHAVVADDGRGTRSANSLDGIELLFDEDPPPSDEDRFNVIKELVGLSGGYFHVESSPGLWTRYELVLPVQRRASPGVAADTLTPTITARSEEKRGLEVLLVDDNSAFRSVMKRYLRRRGHRVSEAKDGEDALRIIEQREFDRLLIDLDMPRKDGAELFRELQAQAPSLCERVIFLSGGFAKQRTRKFVSLTGRPTLDKPFDLGKLAHVLEQPTAETIS